MAGAEVGFRAGGCEDPRRQGECTNRHRSYPHRPWDRKVEIAGAFHPASRVISISKFDSGIDVLALARAMMPDAVGSLSAASTSGGWWISGAGEIPVDQPENFRWNGDVALDGDLVCARGRTN